MNSSPSNMAGAESVCAGLHLTSCFHTEKRALKTFQNLDLRTLCLQRARSLLGGSDIAHQSAFDADPVACLQKIIDGLCDLSLQDALTGLANRRHFRAVLEREIDRASRLGETALLLMIDIDHFKLVNDTHGHSVGDKVLQAVARSLARCVRPMDSLARYGGEEFAMVLPTCPSTLGFLVAERIRHAVEKTVIHIEPGIEVHVTISIGGAFVPKWAPSTTDLWLERADQQLYKAKSEGRNRVCIEHTVESTTSAEEKKQRLQRLQTPSLWGNLPNPDGGT